MFPIRSILALGMFILSASLVGNMRGLYSRANVNYVMDIVVRCALAIVLKELLF